jgi:hypothetical protein
MKKEKSSTPQSRGSASSESPVSEEQVSDSQAGEEMEMDVDPDDDPDVYQLPAELRPYHDLEAIQREILLEHQTVNPAHLTFQDLPAHQQAPIGEQQNPPPSLTFDRAVELANENRMNSAASSDHNVALRLEALQAQPQRQVRKKPDAKRDMKRGVKRASSNQAGNTQAIQTPAPHHFPQTSEKEAGDMMEKHMADARLTEIKMHQMYAALRAAKLRAQYPNLLQQQQQLQQYQLQQYQLLQQRQQQHFAAQNSSFYHPAMLYGMNASYEYAQRPTRAYHPGHGYFEEAMHAHDWQENQDQTDWVINKFREDDIAAGVVNEQGAGIAIPVSPLCPRLLSSN